MHNINEYTLAYLEKKLPFFIVIDEPDGKTLFTCPECLGETTGSFADNWKIKCSKCDRIYGDVVTYFSTKEKKSRELVIADIKKVLEIPPYDVAEANRLFDFYEKNDFDLVPVLRGGKSPIEKGWPNKPHKFKEEWDTWLQDGINIGVKTGKASNIIVLDLDTKDIPSELSMLHTATTLTQITKKGYHYFFKYDAEIPNSRIEKWKLDIQSDGAQVVIAPSIVEDTDRSMGALDDIEVIPEELKKLLLENIDKKKINISEEQYNVPENIDISNINFNNIEEGERNVAFMHMGGILRKQLNSRQSEYVLRLFNQHFCKPSLNDIEMHKILQSIDKYISFDEKECASRILEYFRIVEEATSKDIEQALGYKKDLTDRAISYLVKEGYLYKKRRIFHIAKKAEWRDTFMSDSAILKYEVPYFHDFAFHREGDMIVIGAKQKVGKSHIAMNMIKRMVTQGIKPYYVSLESGNRFMNIAQNLSLKEGDFNWCIHFNPQDIEIEDDAFTIIDWLLPDDYANTDKLFKHFAEQLVKHRGLLVIFVQLRDNGTFFAKDMIAMFPSLVARYMYEDDNNGEKGAFYLDYIREAKQKMKKHIIPCEYNWDSKELLEVRQ